MQSATEWPSFEVGDKVTFRDYFGNAAKEDRHFEVRTGIVQSVESSGNLSLVPSGYLMVPHGGVVYDILIRVERYGKVVFPLLAAEDFGVVYDAGGKTVAELVNDLADSMYHDPFSDIAQEMIEIHDRKGADYGSLADPYTNVRMSEAFGLPAWVGVGIRMNDKMVRLQTAVRQYMQDGKVRLKQEGLVDIANDFAVYGVILRIMIEEAIADGSLVDASEGQL